MTHPLVAVVWDDAKACAVVEYAENEARTQFHGPARYTAYGLLIVDDPQGVTLASEEGADSTVRGLSFIPRAMIIDTKHLLPRRYKRKVPPPALAS